MILIKALISNLKHKIHQTTDAQTKKSRNKGVSLFSLAKIKPTHSASSQRDFVKYQTVCLLSLKSLFFQFVYKLITIP